MMTDPIADLLTRIRNGVAVESRSVDVPYSRIKQDVCRVLVEEGFLVQFQVVDGEPRKTLRVQLKYGPDGERVIQHIKRVSKPGCRVYRKAKDIPVVLQGLGISILSTSQGILSNREATEKGIGGEVLCSVL